MKNDAEIFNKTYLESFINEEKDYFNSPDPEITPDTGNPIDDLTKENSATIDEDLNDNNEEKKKIDITIQNEDSEENEEEFEDEGWGDDISKKLNYLLDELENFTYEIRNCTRGAYTNCKTKDQLINYMTNDLVDMITNAAEEI